MHLEALTSEGKDLYPFLHTFKEFYLAGGTGLALQIGHRISVDFDLFSQQEIEAGLLTRGEQVFGHADVTVSVNHTGELTVFVRGVKLTFLSYPFPPVLKLASLDGLPTLSVKEIGATKAYTIGRRGAFKDYIDLYFILKEAYASLEEIIVLAQKKYGSEFNDRLFLEQLAYLDDLDEEPVVLLREKSLTRKDLGVFFADCIRAIRL